MKLNFESLIFLKGVICDHLCVMIIRARVVECVMVRLRKSDGREKFRTGFVNFCYFLLVFSLYVMDAGVCSCII